MMIDGSDGKPPWDLSGLSKVTMGPGWLGRTSSIVALLGVAGCIAAGAIAYAGSTYLAFALVLLLMLGAAVYIWLAKDFVKKNPHISLMENAVFYRWLKFEMAAKDPKIITEEPPLVPNEQAPKALTDESSDA